MSEASTATQITITRDAPAKINLDLHIVGRRSDGYHLLDSLFLPLHHGDRIEVRCRPAVTSQVTCTCPDRPELAGPQNLASRAAKALLAATGVSLEVALSVHKRTWVAAGLGGGSSDAASVLLALQEVLVQLGHAPLDPQRLSQIALRLGADVPFFLGQGPQRAEGIGFPLTPVQGVPLHLVLVNPDQALSTSLVYQTLGRSPGWSVERPPCVAERSFASAEEAAQLVHNDLEAPAIRLCPAIGELKAALFEAGALAASVSGSGPTVFGIFADGAASQAALERLEAAIRAGKLVGRALTTITQ